MENLKEIQDQLFQQIKEKMPSNVSFVHEIAELLGISYDSDINKAIAIIQDEVSKHPNFLDNRTEEDIKEGRFSEAKDFFQEFKRGKEI